MFSLQTLQLQIKIPPAALSDPQEHFHNYVQTLLLKYSHRLEGIPIGYDILGMSQKGDLYSNCPFLFCDCLVEFLLFKVKIGDVIFVKDDMILGNFECEDAGEGFVRIEKIYEEKGVIKFTGNKIQR